jgi:hypothetical protein
MKTIILEVPKSAKEPDNDFHELQQEIRSGRNRFSELLSGPRPRTGSSRLNLIVVHLSDVIHRNPCTP